MSLKWKKKAILAKIESVYGEDALPSGAANAILASNVTIKPLNGPTAERDTPRAYLGNYQTIHIGGYVEIEFDVEMAGAGAVGNIPAYGPLKRACGNSETQSAGVDTQYDPVSEGEESITLYFNIDGQQHPAVGVRGTESARVNAKGLPYWHYKMMGLWVDPSSVAAPVADYSGFVTPLGVCRANTTFTLHGVTANMSTFAFDQNAKVGYRNLTGLEEIYISDRAPTAKAVIAAPTLDVKNFFTAAKGDVLGVGQIVHGTTGGNIVQADFPSVQVVGVDYQDDDSNLMLGLDLKLLPVDGDDEYLFTIK